MSEAVTQVETKPAAPAAAASAQADSIVVVTGETMEAFTEARGSGSEFKSPDAPKPAPQAKVEAVDDVEAAKPVETENAVHEDGIWKPKEGKPLSKKQIEANERFSKATNARKEAETRATMAEQQVAALKAKYEAPAAPVDVEPDPQKYTDAKVFAEDYYNWKENEKRRVAFAESEQRAAAALEERFKKDLESFKPTISDWDEREAARKNLQMHKMTIFAIQDSDYPARIFHEMTAEKVAEINAMNVAKQVKEIHKIEDRIAKELGKGGETAAVAKIAPVEEVEVSQAPAPVKPIKAVHQEPSNKVDKDGNFIGTQDEYEAYRRAGKIGEKYH